MIASIKWIILANATCPEEMGPNLGCVRIPIIIPQTKGIAGDKATHLPTSISRPLCDEVPPGAVEPRAGTPRERVEPDVPAEGEELGVLLAVE